MGVGDQVPPGLQQLGAQVTLLGETRAGRGRPLAVRRHHDRHARLRGARGPQDLQPAAARLREGRRQHDRALQHPGVRAGRVRAVSGELPRSAEEVSEEDSPVEILAAGASGVHLAEQDHQRGLRRLGGAARLEVLHQMGRGLHADDRHLRQGAGAAEGRLGDRDGTARATGPTSPTRSTGSCRTACPEPIGCSPTCSRSASRRNDGAARRSSHRRRSIPGSDLRRSAAHAQKRRGVAHATVRLDDRRRRGDHGDRGVAARTADDDRQRAQRRGGADAARRIGARRQREAAGGDRTPSPSRSRRSAIAASSRSTASTIAWKHGCRPQSRGCTPGTSISRSPRGECGRWIRVVERLRARGVTTSWDFGWNPPLRGDAPDSRRSSPRPTSCS